MRFVLAMAVRETRASWQRLIFFFICIAVGVAAIVALRSVIRSVRDVLGGEARSLIAADALIATSREWKDDARAKIDKRLADARATARTETIETPTMVRPADTAKIAVRMVELKAIQPGFPLYGSLTLESGQPYSHSLLEHHGALVRPELLSALGVNVGDSITIGTAPFVIRGVVANEPGRNLGAFSLGPRVFVDFDDMPSTGLLVFGSRARRVILARVPDEVMLEDMIGRLNTDFAEDYINARSYRATDDAIGRDFDRSENYLSLVGLVIVILGGIAVSSVTRVFVLQKIRSIAVLKCVGATSRQIIGVYLLQVMSLGLAGSLLGVAIARLALAGIPLALGPASTSLLAEVHYTVNWRIALQGITIGVLVSLLFSLVPLLEVRLVKPSLLLRDETRASGRDPARIAAMVFVSSALVAVAAWQAASLRIGVVICVGFAGLAIVLLLAGRLLVKVVSPLANAPSFPLRHAVLHLSRPGNQTRVILLAVGLGAFFIVGVRSLEANLLSEFSIQVGNDTADMFLLDIQRNQVEGMRQFFADPANGVGTSRLIPVLRARVTGVSGRITTLESFEDVRARGSLAREYTVTYRDHLEANERVLAGTFWNGPSTEPEVSIEKGLRERFAITVGDVVRFDILGKTVNARVTSVRDVDFKDARAGGFMFVFRPGVLEQAPQTYIAPLKGPDGAGARAKLQHDLVAKFPNVSVIDFHEILATIRDVMSKVTLAITVVGGLVLFSGALILVGAVAMTKFQRVYEAAVFKTLGANTGTIARMLLFEYGVLGLLAGAVGSAGAVALTWGVSRFALDIPWRVFPAEHVGGVGLTTVLVAAIGVLSSLDVLRNKPLATLRAE
jgi:putative ABC transport system permease protein